MPLDLEETKTLLRRTPDVLDVLLRGLPDPWVHENEGPDTWSSFDVVGHLIEAEETNWIPRLRHLLAHGESAVFPPFDRFRFVERSTGKSMAEMLGTFERARARSLQDLDELRLTPGDLRRRGRHPDYGQVTLGQLLATWAIHEFSGDTRTYWLTEAGSDRHMRLLDTFWFRDPDEGSGGSGDRRPERA